MIRKKVREARYSLNSAWYQTDYKQFEESLEEMILASFADETENILFDVEPFLDLVLPFPYQDETFSVPDNILEQCSDNEYILTALISIPMLLPHATKAEFQLLIQDTMFIKRHQTGVMDFVSLPYSDWAISDDPEEQIFSMQDAHFVIGFQDQGLGPLHFLDYFTTLHKNTHKLYHYILKEERKRGA